MGAEAEACDGFTARVGDRVAAVQFDHLTEPVIERVRQVVLDWLGVTIAGSLEPSARIAQKLANAEGGHRCSSVVGTPLRTSAMQAAFANGVAAHAMDFDDMGLGCHPSVPVVTAVLALAEERGTDGRAAMEAVVAGFEGLALVGLSSGISAYLRGFHSTGTFGVFGSASGCGRLLGLDPLEMQWALGLAATQAAGLRATFGTMGKHLNAAKAAVNGLHAARLANEGFTGPIGVIESSLGFEVAHNADKSDFDPARADEELAGRLGVELISFKAHASCAGTHSSVASIRKLRADRKFSADDIDHVVITVPGALPAMCGIDDPATGLEGKFSLRYVAALALSGCDTGPAGFTDLLVKDPELSAVRQRVELVPVEGRPLGAPTPVTIRLRGGEELSACVNPLLPAEDADLPEQWNDLVAKFIGLTDPVLGTRRAKDLVATVRRFDQLPSVVELMDRTRFVAD